MKRLQTLLIICQCLAIQTMNAQGIYFDWAKSIGGTGQENVYGNVIDNDGNIYTTGSFNGSVDFNPDTATHILTSNGGSDIYIQKLSSDGSFLWAKSIGGGDTDGAEFITTDNDGNIYVTGIFSLTVDFDPGTAINNRTSAVLQVSTF